MTSIAFQISSEAPLKVNQNNIQNMYKPERIKFLGFSRCRNVIWEIEILIVAGKKFWSTTEDTDKKEPFHQKNYAEIQDTRYSRGCTRHMGLETEFTINLVHRNSDPPLMQGILSKTPRGCLKPQIVPKLIYTVFSHTY